MFYDVASPGDLFHDLPRPRFEALASYCRDPLAPLVATEVRWLATADERLLASVVRDVADGDYAAVLLARDLVGRYRWVAMTAWHKTVDEVNAELPSVAQQTLEDFEAVCTQGDEAARPVDFFEPLHEPERLTDHFRRLADHEGYSPARGIIEAMMRWHKDTDRNFVEQFQTTGFDARMWELYLFAALQEAGYRVSPGVPDLQLEAIDGGLVFVEATTAGPPGQGADEPPTTDDTPLDRAYWTGYLPIRFAGPLVKKLEKRYWERPNVAGHPLVLAIQDFHAPMSMTWSRSALPMYLYGREDDAQHDSAGRLIIASERMHEHRWGNKVIPSGFFDQADAEHISAVIFNNGATISKFNRMGAIAGFGSPRVKMIRLGLAVDLDPSASMPVPFRREVDGSYAEDWMEGMDVYHNPRAAEPLPPDALPGAAHHRLLGDGNIETTAPGWHTLASITEILCRVPT